MSERQQFAIGERVTIHAMVTRYAGQAATIMDYGYHMSYNPGTGRPKRRYDYAVLTDDGAAFRLSGKWLAAAPAAA